MMTFVLGEIDKTFELETDRGTAECWQALSQKYKDMVVSAGLVDGVEPDTVYFQMSRDGEETLTLLLRPDEMQAIAWVCNGALFSHALIEPDAEIKESR